MKSVSLRRDEWQFLLNVLGQQPMSTYINGGCPTLLQNMVDQLNAPEGNGTSLGGEALEPQPRDTYTD